MAIAPILLLKPWKLEKGTLHDACSLKARTQFRVRGVANLTTPSSMKSILKAFFDLSGQIGNNSKSMHALFFSKSLAMKDEFKQEMTILVLIRT